MRRKYKRFNSPPFYVAESVDKIPKKVIQRFAEHNISENALKKSMKFAVWFKAYSPPQLWGNTPFLLVSHSSIHGFDAHDFKTIRFDDIESISFSNKQIIIQLNKKINNRDKIALISTFKLKKSLVTELGQKLKNIHEDFTKSKLSKIKLLDSQGNELGKESNDPKDFLAICDSKVDSNDDFEDNFRNSSPMMKIYTVIFWFLIISYITGGLTLSTWNPNKMYKKITSQSDIGDEDYEKTDPTTSDEDNNKVESSNQSNIEYSDNYCYKYEIRYSAEASNGTGWGQQTSEFITENKIENYDELSENAIRHLWFEHCTEDSEDKWKYWNFRIIYDGYIVCN